MNRVKVISLLISCFVGTSGYAQTDTAIAVTPKIIDSISRAATLSTRLPENSIAYLRIPSIWGVMSAPDRGNMDIVLSDAAHVSYIQAIRSALEDKKKLEKLLIPKFATSSASLLAPALEVGITSFLLQVMDGPLEVVMIDERKMLSAKSRFFATVPVSLKTLAEVNQFLQPFTLFGVGQLDSNNYGVLSNHTHYYFDSKTARLYLLSGLGVKKQDLVDMLAIQETSVNESFMSMEQAIDRSGQRFFGWFSLEKSSAALAAMIPKNNEILQNLVFNMRTFAFGAGVDELARGQLKTIIEMPFERVFNIKMSADSNPVEFNTVGSPSYAFTARLPEPSLVRDLIRLSTRVTADTDVNLEVLYQQKMNQLIQILGFNPVDILAAIGPEVVVYEDDLGLSLAVKLRDKKKLAALIKRIQTRYHLTIDPRNGYYYLKVPSLLLDRMREEMQQPQISGVHRIVSNELLAAATGMRVLDKSFHLYWQQEDDWLFFNKLPHMLMDRKNAHVNIRNWFDHQQGYNTKDTVLGMTGTVKNAQRRWYKNYLSFLRDINDELELNLDITSLPLLTTLALKPETRFGVEFQINPEFISATLSYDSSPNDFNIYGGVGNVALVGLMSALALPAYQDYSVRADVSEGLKQAIRARIAVVEFYAAHERWPASNAEAGLPYGGSFKNKALQSINVQQNGVIVVQYNQRAQHGTIELKPETNGSGIQWSCTGGKMAAKYRPVSCRH